MIMDRLAAYFWWNDQQSGDEALDRQWLRA